MAALIDRFVKDGRCGLVRAKIISGKTPFALLAEALVLASKVLLFFLRRAASKRLVSVREPAEPLDDGLVYQRPIETVLHRLPFVRRNGLQHLFMQRDTQHLVA